MTGAETSLVITAVVTGAATLLTAIAGFIKVLRRQDQTDGNVQRLEKNTDGMKDELIREVRAAALAQGKKEEKDNPS